ncbi:hypothetical protein AVEN_129761-1 [Araneus ventricosus]|uniref:Uncharacterized protein n=1 Tax=Araneus ventricosus TaxID=182803 RepID=A0A4Y2NUY6_ARAVE|nr:hypothetical protein AVEN_129761-1 [Araneus ventricosus]
MIGRKAPDNLIEHRPHTHVPVTIMANERLNGYKNLTFLKDHKKITDRIVWGRDTTSTWMRSGRISKFSLPLGEYGSITGAEITFDSMLLLREGLVHGLMMAIFELTIGPVLLFEPT